MTKIKICGLSRLCDIEAVNSEKPEYIGFVFAPSRRRVTPEQALQLRKALNPEIIPVGVFVNETAEKIISLAHNGIIEMIQLHGSEDEIFIASLKNLTNKAVIKAVSVEKEGDVQKWTDSTADFLLLDNKNGGTGMSFDWKLIGNVIKPFFLAGGLDAENAAEAVKKVKPYAADVSSGVETEGFKDPKKISEFIRRVRGEQ